MLVRMQGNGAPTLLGRVICYNPFNNLTFSNNFWPSYGSFGGIVFAYRICILGWFKVALFKVIKKFRHDESPTLPEVNIWAGKKLNKEPLSLVPRIFLG